MIRSMFRDTQLIGRRARSLASGKGKRKERDTVKEKRNPKGESWERC